MRISDWSSDVCSSDLLIIDPAHQRQRLEAALELVAIAEVPAIAAIADGILPGAVFDAALGFANVAALDHVALAAERSEEHTSELPSLMRISYAVFCFKKITHTYTSISYNY